ncbi:MAG: hypothetical protein V4585_02400 [Bacteroidota bacterium]
MKTLLISVFTFLLSFFSSTAQTKAFIDKQTKQFSLTANIRQDHKFFGYAEANINAKKMIVFSVFTTDVEGNPYKCPLGAYYDTSGLPEGDQIMFVSTVGNFTKLNYINAKKEVTSIYIRRKYVDFL